MGHKSRDCCNKKRKKCFIVANAYAIPDGRSYSGMGNKIVFNRQLGTSPQVVLLVDNSTFSFGLTGLYQLIFDTFFTSTETTTWTIQKNNSLYKTIVVLPSQSSKYALSDTALIPFSSGDTLSINLDVSGTGNASIDGVGAITLIKIG